jgi:hypothetical protein
MKSDLHALSYFSRNRIVDADGPNRQELAHILGTARHNNRQLGITGALLFTEVYFAQILEGPLGAVETLFERIQCDRRHSDVTVLSFHPVASRRFAGWSMAYAGLGDGADDDMAFDEPGHDLVAVLRELIGRHDQQVRMASDLRRTGMGSMMHAHG